MSVHTVTLDHDLYPGDLIALEFLVAAKAQEGDITVGDTTAVGDFSERTDATISSMISEALAFWTTGLADAGGTDGAITGLSTTTPREYFDCFISHTSDGTGTWRYADGAASTGTTITSHNFALALRGLAAAGQTTLGNAIFDWLMTFTSNSDYELPSEHHEQYRSKNLLGTYDPKTAPATILKVREGSPLAATKKNGSAVYALHALGLLASYYSSRQRASFDTTKNTLNDPKAKRWENSERDNERLFLPLQGECGLSMQPSYETPVPKSRKRAEYAAQTGCIYRHEPKAFLGRGTR